MKEIPLETYLIQIWTLSPVFFNVLMFGCTSGWISNTILFFQQGDEVKATAFECSLIASSSELGYLIFAIPGGILLDKYGRKKFTIGTGLLNFISWILLSISSSISAILVARFLSGIGLALGVSSTVVFIGEIASHNNRAQLCSLCFIFIYLGGMYQSIISLLFSSYFILSYCSLALSCLFFVTLFWILETPQYLISVSNIPAARTNLEYIRPGYTEKEIDFEFSGMQSYILSEQKEQQQLKWLQFLKSESIREPLITVVLIGFFTNAMGGFLIGSFIITIIPENDVPKKYYPLIMQLLPLMVILISVSYIEKFPRRTIYLIGVAFIGVISICLVVTDYCYIELRSDLGKWIFIVGILLRDIITNAYVYPMNKTLKSELFPQSVKGFGSSLSNTFEAMANIILFQSYNLINSYLGRQYYVFVILTVNSLILYLLVYFRLPEARGQYLADLQKRPDGKTLVQTDYGSTDRQQT